VVAWHDREVTGHLAHLVEVRDGAGNPGARLEAVFEAYALITYERPHDTEAASLVHRGEHVGRAQRHLRDFVRDLLAEAAATGDVRGDVAVDELASYCVYALTAAGSLPSKAAVRRLVTVILAGIRTPALTRSDRASTGFRARRRRGRSP